MRDDMAKVVTERPRRGHGNASRKTSGPRIRRFDPENEYEGPTRLPVARERQYGYEAKEFSGLINPLKRYLRSCSTFSDVRSDSGTAFAAIKTLVTATSTAATAIG